MLDSARALRERDAQCRVRHACPRRFASLTTPRATLTFYQGDCLAIVPGADPADRSTRSSRHRRTTSAFATRHEDTLPRADYLAWTRRWVRGTVARALHPDGSLFLNVGAKPTDPWAAFDVALAARRHLQLQNTIHWVKSIAIDREAVGDATGLRRDLAVGHYKPINSSLRQRLPRVRLPLPPPPGRPGSIARRSACLSGPVERQAVAGRGAGPALPRERLVPAVRHDQEPGYAIGRIRPRSRRACLSSACSFTAPTACGSSSTRSPAWAPRRWRARGSGSTSSGSISTRSISMRQCARTEAAAARLPL